MPAKLFIYWHNFQFGYLYVVSLMNLLQAIIVFLAELLRAQEHGRLITGTEAKEDSLPICSYYTWCEAFEPIMSPTTVSPSKNEQFNSNTSIHKAKSVDTVMAILCELLPRFILGGSSCPAFHPN